MTGLYQNTYVTRQHANPKVHAGSGEDGVWVMIFARTNNGRLFDAFVNYVETFNDQTRWLQMC